MSFLDILYTVLIGPLQLFFETIYSVAYRVIGNPGLSIIVLSLAMNFLVLPLYKRADAMQDEQRDTEMRLKKGVDHIKMTFKGDDRMMMLQTYYRQNNYKPMDALKGSVSLFLEIPFFIAAYRFLSNLSILQGVSFGPIADLGTQDRLITIGALSINVLPVLMTAINLISCVIYTKGYPLKTKIQLYGMAVFFLIFLYTSPSGLVFYWTLNNLFSLIKTICYKIKDAKIILVIKEKLSKLSYEKTYSSNNKVFTACCIFLTVLVGALIPSAVVNDSPLEFIDPGNFYHPSWYIAYAFCLSAGLFLVWCKVFYGLATEKGKVIFEKLIEIASFVAVVDYMFFGRDLGIMNSSLIFDNGVVFSGSEKIINLLVILGVAGIVLIAFHFLKKQAAAIFMILAVAISVMSISNLAKTSEAVSLYHNTGYERDFPNVTLSKTEQNVVVIMLDRAIGLYVPYIMNERPDLIEKFDGFTYYDNVVSFGAYTNFGVPPLVGGYEYTPEEMNKRDTESLMDKHNEALLTLPVIFGGNGYEVTLFNPPYANYSWIPDLSLFNDYDYIHAYNTYGMIGSAEQREFTIDHTSRNFFCYSFMKIMPAIIQAPLYDLGKYNSLDYLNSEAYLGQSIESKSISIGLNPEPVDYFNTISALSDITEVSEDANGAYFFYDSEITHDVLLYSEPDYEPSQSVDNTEYDLAHESRFTVDNKTIEIETGQQMAHYQSNMAAFIQLGKWLDYLRENDVYDNTRIIIAADHGSSLRQSEDLIFDSDMADNFGDAEYYYPLLMVKDFNSTGFTTSSEFMTNADVPTLALKEVIDNPRNPFTGNEINNDAKYIDDIYILASEGWGINANNGSVFFGGEWISVHDNIWDKNNWKVVQHESTSPREYIEWDMDLWKTFQK